MGFKVVHTGHAKPVSMRVKKTAEMIFSTGWRISTRKTRCTNLRDRCQSMMQIAKGVMIGSRGDGGRDDMLTLHWYQLAQI